MTKAKLSHEGWRDFFAKAGCTVEIDGNTIRVTPDNTFCVSCDEPLSRGERLQCDACFEKALRMFE